MQDATSQVAVTKQTQTIPIPKGTIIKKNGKRYRKRKVG